MSKQKIIFENQNDISLLNNDVATWESKGAISESRANVKTLDC